MTGEPDLSGSRASGEPTKTSTTQSADEGAGEEPKKPYLKPSFEYERVFETMALRCGKVASTERLCHFNRKTS